MPGQECLGCGAVHAIGAPACPQCGSTDAVEEGATAAAAGSRFPIVEMKCGTPGCPAQGVLRRVPLAQPVPGLIAMPPDVVCAGCSYVPMLTRGWPIPAGPLGKVDEEMPKVTVHGGPSNENPPDLGTPAEPSADDDAGSGAVPEPAPEPEPDTGSESAPDSPARPRLSASRADWEAYAIGAGLPEGDAKGMTKGQLQGWVDDPAGDPAPDPEPAGGGPGSESEPG